MMKVDLITGFLGAGKTTFIREYLRALEGCSERIKLIENEFGPLSVDKMLLSDLDVPTEDLTGRCMCCTGKTMFIQMLQSAAAEGYDRVLVEPSGIYDVDEFFYTMRLDALRDCCEIGNVISIFDPETPETLSGEMEYLMGTQLLPAGVILLSRTGETSREKIAKALERIRELFVQNGSSEDPIKRILIKPWQELELEDYEQIRTAGHTYHLGAGFHEKQFSHTELFRSVIAAVRCENEEVVCEKVQALFTERTGITGTMLRVKGLAQLSDRSWVEVNATKNTCFVKPRDVRRGLMVMIGQEIEERELQTYWANA